MNSLEYGFEPTDLDDELFLSQVPLDILVNSIKSQFQDPLEYRKKDYVQSFITKYDFSKENMLEDDQVLVDEYNDQFLAFMEQIFEEKLGVGFTNIDDLSTEDQHELVHLTYRFFIKNIKKNFVNIVQNYIEENKKDIQSSYEKKKDVTALTFKTEIDNEYDILVLSNLGQIINEALDSIREEDDLDKFLELCNDEEPVLELEYVKNAYNEMELTGNFVEKYIDMIDGEFKSEIQSKVRNKILKKYPKRTKRSDVVEDDETENNTELNPTETNEVSEPEIKPEESNEE